MFGVTQPNKFAELTLNDPQALPLNVAGLHMGYICRFCCSLGSSSDMLCTKGGAYHNSKRPSRRQ